MNEEITLQVRGNIKIELMDLLRVENGSRKLIRLPSGFYERLQNALAEIQKEKAARLMENEITEYIELGVQENDIMIVFKMFFERRFEKIAAVSLYSLGLEIISQLTEEEREAYEEFHSVSEKLFRTLMGGKI